MPPTRAPLSPALIADAAALLAEPARVAMLLSLLDGTARPASELARIAAVTPPTASSHLHKLLEGGLLVARRHGRYRLYALADEQVSNALESVAASLSAPETAPRQEVSDPAAKLHGAHPALRFARTCYRHLAGVLAVRLADALEARDLTQTDAGTVTLTARGRAILVEARLLASTVSEGLTGKACPDWTERRAHIAGPLGLALLDGLLGARWIAPRRGSRAVRVTALGEAQLRRLFGIHASEGC